MSDSKLLYNVIFEYFVKRFHDARIVSIGEIKNGLTYLQIEYYKNSKKDLLEKFIVNLYWKESKEGTIKNRTIEKLNVYEGYEDFDKSDLKFFYENGFKLSEEHTKETRQEVEDWF